MSVLNNPMITLDCDWAPDFVLEYVADILTKNKVKATWFITNKSPFLSELESNPLFELGIHPNFDMNSTHGNSVDEVLTNMKKIVPDALSIRTHNLFQSTPILLQFQKYGIKNDVSLLLYKTPNLQPHYLKYFKLFRLPFFWEDDLEMEEQALWNETNIFSMKGLKIFNFHPIHIFLNSKDFSTYNTLKMKKDLLKIKISDIEHLINKKEGVQTMFDNLISYQKNSNTYTISEIKGKITSENDP
jgi:hypothetical protein